jgi:hypothetical protein
VREGVATKGAAPVRSWQPTTTRWAEEKEEERVFNNFYLGQSRTPSASPSRPSSLGNGSGCSEFGSGGGTTTPDLFTMAGTSSSLAPSAPITSRGSHDEHHQSVDPTPLPTRNDMW